MVEADPEWTEAEFWDDPKRAAELVSGQDHKRQAAYFANEMWKWIDHANSFEYPCGQGTPDPADPV